MALRDFDEYSLEELIEEIVKKAEEGRGGLARPTHFISQRVKEEGRKDRPFEEWREFFGKIERVIDSGHAGEQLGELFEIRFQLVVRMLESLYTASRQPVDT